MPTRAQQGTVILAFAAAAVSLATVVIRAIRYGVVEATPLFGGLLMLALAIAGYSRLKSSQRS